MVRRADEVCVEDLFPSGSCAAAIRFDGHKHRIDVGKNIGSVHRLLVVLSSIVN